MTKKSKIEHNYFLYTIIFLIVVFFSIVAVLDSYMRSHKSYVEHYLEQSIGFINDSLVNTFSCSVPTEISQDPVMRVVGDSVHTLAPTYIPNDLVYIPQSMTRGDAVWRVRSGIYAPTIRLFDAAARAGIILKFNSGHRPFVSQDRIFKNYDWEWGDTYLAAEPGFSEHQLGTAIDISGLSYSERAYTWLKNNAYKYGFILSYPDGAQDITNFQYEPWHWRYVGTDVSRSIHQSGELFNEQTHAFMVNPFDPDTIVPHAFVSEHVFMGLVRNSRVTPVTNSSFLDEVLDNQDIIELVTRHEASSFEIETMLGEILFDSRKKEYVYAEQTYEQYSLRGHGSDEEDIFIELLRDSARDSIMMVAYRSDTQQSDILIDFMLDNCR